MCFKSETNFFFSHKNTTRNKVFKKKYYLEKDGKNIPRLLLPIHIFFINSRLFFKQNLKRQFLKGKRQNAFNKLKL